MGERHIYRCPFCGGDIYVGGGVNEYDNYLLCSRIQCFDCKHWFSIEVDLIDITDYMELQYKRMTGRDYEYPKSPQE